MRKTKEQKAITLVVLVVTIIILLILAGVTILTLTGNGLFEKAKLAKEKQENAQNKEESTLADYENNIDDYVCGSRTDGSSVKVVTVWEGTNTSGTISLGDYKISDYDFIYLVAGYPTSGDFMTSTYMVEDITINSSKIGVCNDSNYIWYTVTRDNELTLDERGTIALFKVKLIKL